jgi:AcrR family transcriptional regulator
MPRPSRNLDRALIAAGRALLPEVGCAGLTIRQVADAAGVNIGMFHYHFRTREAFLRAVMQETYEEMFAQLTLEVARPLDTTPVEHLRSAMRVLARFARDNRRFIARILADTLGGDATARAFIAENLPRHFTILAGLIQQGQADGSLRALAPRQALAFCIGSVAMPILVGGAAADLLPKHAAQALHDTLLADAALDQRIDLALAAIAAPAAKRVAGTPKRTPRKKKGSP